MLELGAPLTAERGRTGRGDIPGEHFPAAPDPEPAPAPVTAPEPEPTAAPDLEPAFEAGCEWRRCRMAVAGVVWCERSRWIGSLLGLEFDRRDGGGTRAACVFTTEPPAPTVRGRESAGSKVRNGGLASERECELVVPAVARVGPDEEL